MSGLEHAAAFAGKSPRSVRHPSVAVTADQNPSWKDLCLQVGHGTAWLRKPCRPTAWRRSGSPVRKLIMKLDGGRIRSAWQIPPSGRNGKGFTANAVPLSMLCGVLSRQITPALLTRPTIERRPSVS